MRSRLRFASGAALALAVAGLAAAAGAHVVYGAKTLRMLTAESDLVVRARIVDAGSAVALGDAGERETLLTAEVLEALKGAPPEGELRFAQHGHGTPEYAQGEEVALFLQRIERSRELAGSPVAGRVGWVSLQEAGAKYPLDDASHGAFAAALRDYAALEALPAAERTVALRRLTLALLGSPHRALASSAVRDVALAGDALVTADDLAVLEPLLASGDTPVEVRVALLAVLERRGLVEGPPRWARLVRETTGRDRFNAVRAAAAHPSPPVTRELVALLGDDDPLLVSTAAISLGVPGNEAAVEPLAKLLASEQPRVRMAAIRGLGRIGTPGALRQLSQAAARHADPATRRRAAAEVRLLGGEGREAGAGTEPD